MSTVGLLLNSYKGARARYHARPFGICGRQNGVGTGFSSSASVFPSHYGTASIFILIYSSISDVKQSEQLKVSINKRKRNKKNWGS
jgi:hypothetical protein